MNHESPSRTLPHSIEAEEFLLSSIFIDAADVVLKAREAGITAASFYDSKYAVVFDCICSLLDAGKPTEIHNVAEELKTTKQLEVIGGYAILTQISSRVPTTAQANYFIARVRELSALRSLIRAAKGIVEDCFGYTGELDYFLAEAQRKIQAITEPNHSSQRRFEMSWGALMNFDPKADADCLMGNRYVCRGGGLVLVAPSGVGKSVYALQLGGCAALGRACLGLQMRYAMRVLYIQAEDDIGDVSEAAQGFIREYDIQGEELQNLMRRMRIVRWNDAAGEKFLVRLRSELRSNPADLVIINPLFSFCGCDVSNQKEMSAFLRNGLNPILNETRAACVLVHHTNKPKDDEKPSKGDEEQSYLGSGSAELTNWARAYITLQQVKGAGGYVYKMAFAKRGRRAGLVDSQGKPTTSVLIEYSKRGLCWLPSDYTPAKGKSGQFQVKFDLPRACGKYNSAMDWDSNEQAIALDQNVSRKTVNRAKAHILDTAT
jgi:hypothetical protein